MKGRKLKPFVIPAIYTLSILFFATSLFLVKSIMNTVLKQEDPQMEYVDKGIMEEEQYVPVVSTDKIIIKPFTNEKVTIYKNYYDYQSASETQEGAIIYYENTYMQNSGIDYQCEETFDVVAILDGTVINIKSDNILGNIIEVRHNNDLISVYQSLGTINVSLNESVIQGQVLGTSGANNLNATIQNHLHFELYHQGKVVNPENYYNLNMKDL